MNPITFPNEVSINLQKHFTDLHDANIQTGDFYQRFRHTDDLERVPVTHHSITMQAFIPLYNEADNAAQAELADPETEGNAYVTGIRIKIGLSAEGKIKLFFEPIYVIGSIDSATSEFVGGISSTLKNSLNYYEYNEVNERFDTTNKQNYRDALSRYRSNMRISRFRDDQHHLRPYSSSSWRGHVESAMFPFQELFLLYHEKYDELDPDFSYLQSLLLTSACYAVNWDSNPRAWDRFKHTLLFGEFPPDLDIPIEEFLPSPPDDDDLANLAHLCPPSTNCGNVTYPT